MNTDPLNPRTWNKFQVDFCPEKGRALYLTMLGDDRVHISLNTMDGHVSFIIGPEDVQEMQRALKMLMDTMHSAE